jgi:RHS repeat-associated protein
VTLRRAAVPALRALLLALASVVIAAPAHASLPALGDRARASDELHARTSALGADLPRELPTELPKECNGPFCVPPLETRVGGFDLRLSCSVGGEDVLTCGSRLAYGLAYGGRAVERSVFTGHVFEAETGLYYARARYFDPKLGRFLTQDSFLGQIDEPPSLHRYLYAANRPTFYVDPTGHILRQAFDEAINRDTNNSHWLIAGAKALLNEATYQTLDVISFGALHRQDKLVDKNLAGKISDADYYSKTSANVALSAGQAAMTLGTGGAMGATRGAAMGWGAAGGIAGQGVSDVGEIYGTETKSLDDVRARDYFLAGAMGTVGGYAGYGARAPRPTRAGPSQAEKAGLIAEQGQSVTPDVPAPAAAAASTADVNVQPAVNRTYAVGERTAGGWIAGEGPGTPPALKEAFTPSSGAVGEPALSPTTYPNPDPPMSAAPARYEPQTIEEVLRMRAGKGPIPRSTEHPWIEAHHRQKVPMSEGGVMDELRVDTHRMGGSHTRHAGPSRLTPALRGREIRQHYKTRGAEYMTGDGEGI